VKIFFDENEIKVVG